MAESVGARAGRRRPRDGRTVGPVVAARRLPRRARRAPPPPVRHGLLAARAARCCARRSPRWYTARGTPTTPDQILDHDGRAAGDPPAGHGARRPRRPRGRRAPHLPARDRRRARRRRPAGAGAVRRFAASTSTCSSRPCGRSSPRLVYLIPDHRNPTGTSLDDDERAAGACHGPSVPHGDRRRRGPDRADHRRPGAVARTPATARRRPTSSRSARRPRRYWGGLRVGWVRAHPDLVCRLATTRAHTDHRHSGAGAAGRRPSCSRNRPTCWTVAGPSCARTRDLLVGLLLDQLPSWRFDVPRGGLSLWADLGAPVSSALAAISDAARRPGRARARRSAWTAASSRTCGSRSPRHPTTCAEPSPGWPRRGRAWASPHRSTGPDRVHALV